LERCIKKDFRIHRKKEIFMNKKVFLTGILSILLALGLILAGCSNPSGGAGPTLQDFKTDLLTEYSALSPSEKAEKEAEWISEGLPADPSTWTDAQWEQAFENSSNGDDGTGTGTGTGTEPDFATWQEFKTWFLPMYNALPSSQQTAMQAEWVPMLPANPNSWTDAQWQQAFEYSSNGGTGTGPDTWQEFKTGFLVYYNALSSSDQAEVQALWVQIGLPANLNTWNDDEWRTFFAAYYGG
jgi:hypothetical protein